MRRLLSTMALAALALFATASSSRAQCLTPDNLDGGPCCTRAFETVPQFKSVQHKILNICWKDCGVDQQFNYSAKWGATNMVPAGGAFHCGVRTSQLNIRNAAGQLAWTGLMRLQYSRTWAETTTAGTIGQVWRFLVNGDLVATVNAGNSPCPRPPCAASFGGRVRYTGYIDYTFDCVNGVTEAAWMLTHACDDVDHAPGFPRAGSFHANRVYTFVGPSAGFVVNALVPPEAGPIVQEAARRSQLPIPPSTQPIACEYEEKLGGNGVFLNNTFCLCGASGGPQQYADSSLFAAGGCGTFVAPAGTAPIPGFLSMGIGSWTIPGVFPGADDLRWNCGSYSYFDPCTTLTRNEFFFGVTTTNADPAYELLTLGGVGAPLGRIFIDQSNSLRLSNQTLLRNLPYVSDHFLNINLP